ncbi:MAG: hypothetical protein KGL04_07110 [Elusimicrobia bacterium]|nr:hypothetical protein [Elusimicrobiota bacterium]MDE2313925.1 hypothetical protein [Elusimicrobiota bacterium]
MRLAKKIFLTAGALFLPAMAWPCAVCFGGKGMPMGFYRGFFIAVVVTLAITFTLIGAIVRTVLKIEKRREAQS